MKKILFRVDSSLKMGIGHIMRCLVLADQINDANIIFACQNLDGNIMSKIPYSKIILDSNDIEELINYIKMYSIEILIIDHYDIDLLEEEKIKQNVNIKILSFDDNYQKHNCDILLNQSLHANKEKYTNLVKDTTTLLCGKEFILLDKNFYKMKKQKSKQEYVLISLGGGEIENEVIDMVNTIKSFTKLPIIVILPHYVNENLLDKQVEYKNFTTNMAQLIYDAKLVVCSLGMTSYEVIFLNKCILPIKTANNQEEIAKYFIQNDIEYLSLKNLDRLVFKERVEYLIQHMELIYPKNWINPKRGWINQFL